MKKLFITALIFLFAKSAFSQWTANQNGTELHTLDKVGIGNSSIGTDKFRVTTGGQFFRVGTWGLGITDSQWRNTMILSNKFDYHEIYSNGGKPLVLQNSFGGNVGIGTTTPSGILHINASYPEIYLTSDNYAALRGNGGTWLFGYGGETGSEIISIGTQDQTGSRTLSFAAGGFARMKILANGNVGIGTSEPDAKLTVKGNIHAEEVKVDLNVPGPDYVFEENYPLRSLEETKSYIQQNKHLPEIPSAKEMEANGVALCEMNMKLLKKIEELTLYVIDLKRENQELYKQVKELQATISDLMKN